MIFCKKDFCLRPQDDAEVAPHPQGHGVLHEHLPDVLESLNFA